MQKLIELNSQLANLPLGVLVFLMAIGFGYVLKSIKRISNDWIPLWVHIAATALFLCGAPNPGHDPARMWFAKNFCIGLIIGLLSWLSHKLILKRIEKKMGWFVSDDSNPEAFKKKDFPDSKPTNDKTIE